MRMSVRPLTAGLLGLTLLLAGCSSTTAGQAAVATSAALMSTGSAVVDTDSSATSSDTDGATTSDQPTSSESSSSESSSSESLTSLPSIPGGLPSVSVPGFNSACLSVASTYAAVELTFLSVLTGSGKYDGSQALSALQSLGASVPAELKDDFATLTQAVQQANGKSAADAAAILQSASVTKAGDDVKAWMDKNCGG